MLTDRLPATGSRVRALRLRDGPRARRRRRLAPERPVRPIAARIPGELRRDRPAELLSPDVRRP